MNVNLSVMGSFGYQEKMRTVHARLDLMESSGDEPSVDQIIRNLSANGFTPCRNRVISDRVIFD